MIKHVLQRIESKLKEILRVLTSIGEIKVVSSIREKIYQVEKVRLEDAFKAQLKHLEEREKEVKKELKVLSATKNK